MFWFCTTFSLLRCRRGVLGITERVFTQPRRQRLCGGVRCCPHGRRGREGPGDGIAFLLLPRPGKGATSPCQHRSLGKRADVCVSSGTWACEQAVLRAQSWDGAAHSQKTEVFSARRPSLFLPLCIPILLASGTGFTSSLSPGSSGIHSESCPHRLAVCFPTCNLCPGTRPLPVPVPVPCSCPMASPCRVMLLSQCSMGFSAFPELGMCSREFQWHHLMSKRGTAPCQRPRRGDKPGEASEKWEAMK